jgi:hypothetical protein
MALLFLIVFANHLTLCSLSLHDRIFTLDGDFPFRSASTQSE